MIESNYNNGIYLISFKMNGETIIIYANDANMNVGYTFLDIMKYIKQKHVKQKFSML